MSQRRAAALTAVALVVGLALVYALTGAASAPRLAFEGDIPVASVEHALDEGLAYTELFDVDAPSRVAISLARESGDGRLQIVVSLVAADATLVREAAVHVDPTGEIVLSAVPPGRYRLRFLSGFDPSGSRRAKPTPPASVRARALVGGRPRHEPFVLAALLIAPALALGYARRATSL